VTRRNPTAEARELENYIIGDGHLYRSIASAIIKTLANKKSKGSYNHTLAAKAWQHAADAGAKQYVKEFATPGSQVFTVADRKAVASALADYYLEEITLASQTKTNPRHRRIVMAKRRSTKARKTHKRKVVRRVKARKSHKRRVVRRSHKRKARKTVRRVVRRSRSSKLPHRVTFRKGGKHTVVFKHRVATAATKAKRRASGKRLAKMQTKAERMANLRKAQAAWKRMSKSKRSHRRITRR